MSAEDVYKYRELQIKYKTMKSEAKKKICLLETQLKNADGIVKYTKSHLQKYAKNLSIETDTRIQREKELKALSLELDKTKEILKNNEQLFEEEIVKIYSNKSVFTCNQLEDFNVKIGKLTGKLKKSMEKLKHCEEKNQEYENALKEEKNKYKEKDQELSKLAQHFNYIYSELNNTYSKLQTANEQNRSLKSELKFNEELTGRLNEVEKELVYVKHCLTTKTDEIECKNRELNENQDNIIKIKELEDKIISEGEKLKECEKLKNDCDKKCKYLTKEIEQLKTENDILSRNVEKLNNSLLSASEKEQYWQKVAETSDTNLKASIQEIKNLNIEVRCMTEKLNNMEKMLKNTETKLMEETLEKEILKEKYFMVNNCDQLDKLDRLVAQNALQINNQKLELVTLSNENQKIIDVHNILNKRLEDLEATRLSDLIDANEILKQLNETTQRLYHAEQNIKDKEKEVKLTAPPMSKSISRVIIEKILKRQNKALKKIIKTNAEQYNSMNDVMREELKHLKQQYDEKNKNHQIGEQMQGDVKQNGFWPNEMVKSEETKKKLDEPKRETTVSTEKNRPLSARPYVKSNSPPATKSYSRCVLNAGVGTKKSSANYDFKQSTRRIIPVLVNTDRNDKILKKCSSMVNCGMKCREPLNQPKQKTEIKENTVQLRGNQCKINNAAIIAKLSRQLNEKIGLQCHRG